MDLNKYLIIIIDTCINKGVSMENISQSSLWKILNRLIGRWKSEVKGKAGLGKGSREYSKILQGNYLFCTNKAIFEPQDQNPKGEVHEDWGFFNYNSLEDTIKLRVFYSEGYVSLYALEKFSLKDNEFVFVTIDNDNLPKGFRARLTTCFLSNESFSEKFELASPKEDFDMCITNIWHKESKF